MEGWRVDPCSQDINQTQAQLNDVTSHAQLSKSFQELLLELFDLRLLVQLLSAVLESLDCLRSFMSRREKESQH